MGLGVLLVVIKKKYNTIEDQYERLREYLSDKKTYLQIARLENVGLSTIRHRINRMRKHERSN